MFKSVFINYYYISGFFEQLVFARAETAAGFRSLTTDTACVEGLVMISVSF